MFNLCQFTKPSSIENNNIYFRALWSADKFFPFVGLDKPGVDFNTIDPCGVNRSQVCIEYTDTGLPLLRAEWIKALISFIFVTQEYYYTCI